MDKWDMQMLEIFGRLKGLVIDVIFSEKTIIDQIDSVTNFVQINFSKRANLRIPEEYIKGTNTVKNIKLPKTNTKTILQATANVSAVIGQLGPKHGKAVQNMVAEGIGYNAQALKELANNLKLINGKTDTEYIYKVLSANSQNYDKKKAISTQLKDSGIVYMRDSAGHTWTPERYAEMIVRTEAGKGYNQGIINKARELGVDKLIRLEKSDACPICIPHRGEIWDLSQGDPPLLYHPNCKGTRSAQIDIK